MTFWKNLSKNLSNLLPFRKRLSAIGVMDGINRLAQITGVTKTTCIGLEWFM